MNLALRCTTAIFLFLPMSAFGSGAASPAGDNTVKTVQAFLPGRYDNREQSGHAPPGASSSIPHVTVVIESIGETGWTLWHVRLAVDPDSVFEQSWAMQLRTEHDGTRSLIPYYQFKQTAAPSAATFDARQWLSLEACALRGKASAERIEGISEGEPCVAVTMSVGARRALLPVGVMREGEMLHLDLNLRGVRTQIDAKRS